MLGLFAVSTSGAICSGPLDPDDGRDCDRFILGIPYCGVELDCE